MDDRLFGNVMGEVQKAVVGQRSLIEQLVIAAILHGNCLFMGVPGAGQFRITRSVAASLGLRLRRVTLTPDLSADDAFDIVLSEPDRFPQILFAEEIHRASPNTQAAFLEATVSGEVHHRQRRISLTEPLLLVATEGPDEREPRTLTQVQLDRFLFRIAIPSPSYEEEYAIIADSPGETVVVEAVVTHEQLVTARSTAAALNCPPPVLHYALRLIRGTRVHEGEHLDFAYEWIRYGAGPRAAQLLVAASRARAVLHGRDHVIADDVRALTPPILRHRITLNQNAESRGVDADHVIDRLLAETPDREDGDERIPRLFRE